MQIKHWQVIASNLLPSDTAGPIFFEAHEISSDLEQVNLVGIINPSSSSMDGKGNLKAGLLLFGSVEERNLDSKMRLEARHVFFHGCQSGSLWRECRGDINEKITLSASDPNQLFANFTVKFSFLNGAPSVCSSATLVATRIAAD
jgi:hypothetical protein